MNYHLLTCIDVSSNVLHLLYRWLLRSAIQAAPSSPIHLHQ